MNKNPFFKITADGVISAQTAPETPRADYSQKPVHLAVTGSLGIELHGENFSVTTQLSDDAALSLVMLLAYALREKFHAEKYAKSKASQ